MKNIAKLSIVVLIFVLASCKDNKTNNSDTGSKESVQKEEQLYSCSMHPEVIGKKGEKCSKCGMELTEPVSQSTNATTNRNATTNSADETKPETSSPAVAESSFSINKIVSNYLKLKNTLTKDDTQGAANAGKALYITFNAVNSNAIMDAKSKKQYLDIADDAKEHAEHIGDNSGKLEHQREHFAMLSKDINDLIKTFGVGQKVYQNYCPMYDNGKGAIWISETKEIKNPYYGKGMLTCGSVQKEF